MEFRRQDSDGWNSDVPGARWFKADLHIHTIDDLASGKVGMPDGLTGNLASTEVLTMYARRFLQAISSRNIQVAGITPHAPMMGDGPETSAVWRIIEEWNNGVDQDGVPFREKIYALFPGFESTLRDDSQGLHISFLFDPEISLDTYMKAFEIVMGRVAPWQNCTLQISKKRAEEALQEISELWKEECSLDKNRLHWDYFLFVPNLKPLRGLLGAKKSRVLNLLSQDKVAGMQLGSNDLPEQTLSVYPWLLERMEEQRQAFFHASGAFNLSSIGRRYSWVKLATPRIEALRQAYMASESRILIGFEKTTDGWLREKDPPTAASREHPWLREVRISGGASFFGGESITSFRLSPDFTCIIGGSMTGKSTFLDGLRVRTGSSLPDSRPVSEQVEARGRLFAAGAAQIELDFAGSDPAAGPSERWPAQFFAQNELQRLAQDESAVSDLLARLVFTEAEGISRRAREMTDLDQYLSEVASRLDSSEGRIAESEQAFQRAKDAETELARFAAAGVDRLHLAVKELQAWESENFSASTFRNSLQSALTLFELAPDPPRTDKGSLRSEGVDPAGVDPMVRKDLITESVEAAVGLVDKWISDIEEVVQSLKECEVAHRAEVERALDKMGLGATRFRKFQELERLVSLLPSYADVLEKEKFTMQLHQQRFCDALGERSVLVDEQRSAFERVSERVHREFSGRIKVKRVDSGDTGPLERFLEGLGQRGVMRWWNELPEGLRPSPKKLNSCLEERTLGEVGMAEAVQETFQDCMTRSRMRNLFALRCPDRYQLEVRIGDGDYRPLDRLSGGRRVGVLLTLLLESSDNRPLVIDQPEDELDNRFLFETLLPALKKLSGRRQVILATHNANIVVNGDADLVIQLEATADRGRIACAGAIEEPRIRDAIVSTVDGGEDAFRLRRRKYGF